MFALGVSLQRARWIIEVADAYALVRFFFFFFYSLLLRPLFLCALTLPSSVSYHVAETAKQNCPLRLSFLSSLESLGITPHGSTGRRIFWAASYVFAKTSAISSAFIRLSILSSLESLGITLHGSPGRRIFWAVPYVCSPRHLLSPALSSLF